MDALWNLEDKWKLSTQESVIFLVCTCSLVIGVCVVTILMKRRAANRRKGQEPCMDIEWSEAKLLGMKKVLKSSVRWSSASRWEEKASERVSPLLVEGDSCRWQSHNSDSPAWQRPVLMEGDSCRWHSHNSISPVWQRPILMGEKCELPRFSGLILYDERGRPVHQIDNDQFSSYQEKADAVGRTTLRDLF